MPARPVLGWVLRAAAGVVVLAVVARTVGADALRAGTAVLAPAPVAAALLLGLVWRALAAARWLLVARAVGAPLAWSAAFAEYLRGELLNQVLPGAVLGDVDRARRHGADAGLLPAARAVALERAAGYAVLLLAAGLALGSRPELGLVRRGVDGRTGLVLAGAAAVAGAVALVLWQPWRRRPADRAAGLPRPVAAVAAAGAVGLSVGVLACFVTLFVVAARATGTDAPTAQLVPVVLVVLVLAGVPLTVAGWGAREAGAALCFAAAGLAAADGVAAAVGYGLLSLVSALPGLVPLLLPRLSRASAGRARAPRRDRARSAAAGR